MTSPWYRAALSVLFEIDDDAPDLFRRAATVERALANLGSCLRDAGMLCESWQAGWRARFDETSDTSIRVWTPGCGREHDSWSCCTCETIWKDGVQLTFQVPPCIDCGAACGWCGGAGIDGTPCQCCGEVQHGYDDEGGSVVTGPDALELLAAVDALRRSNWSANLGSSLAWAGFGAAMERRGRATGEPYYAVVNDAGYITMTTSPGRPHAALWATQAEADEHLETMDRLNHKFGSEYRVATVRVLEEGS